MENEKKNSLFVIQPTNYNGFHKNKKSFKNIDMEKCLVNTFIPQIYSLYKNLIFN